MAHNSGDPSMKVWVGNLPEQATNEDLDAHFRQLSEPVSAVIYKKGSGCITYDSAEEAEMAISAFNGSEIGDNTIQTDSWAAKMPKGRAGYGGFKGDKGYGKGEKGDKGGGKGGKGGKGSVKGGGPMPSMSPAKGFGKGCGKMAAMYNLAAKGAAAAMGFGGFGPAAYGGAFGAGFDDVSEWGGWGTPSSQWAQEEKPAKQKWVAPVGSTVVHWISVPGDCSIVAQGLPLDAPAVMYEKADTIFSSATNILRDLVGDVSTEVQITHDADWEQFPEIGELVKVASGEENCFAIAVCANKACWAIGVANGWKGREAAAKLALSIALCKSDESLTAPVCKNNPDFRTLCRNQGLIRGSLPVGVPKPVGGKGGGGGSGIAGAAVDYGEVPAIHFVTVEGDNRIREAGLPAEAPAIFFQKSQKEFFSNAHSILSEFIDDVKEECAFEDDPECEIFPEVAQALQAIGAEEAGICIASSAAQSAWGIGLGYGQDGRMRAAKLALGLTICQNQGKLDEFSANYPEFGALCASVGLVQPQKKRRRGDW